MFIYFLLFSFIHALYLYFSLFFHLIDQCFLFIFFREMELAKKFRYFEFQKKSMERKAMIIKDGYYFSLWDAVRITQIGHKWAGYTGEEEKLI